MIGDQISRAEGRHLFGLDPAGYDATRPDYPLWIFEHLCDRGVLEAGATNTLEIGPGTGCATRRLLEYGADPLVLVEPDERFAQMLDAATQVSDADCRVVHSSFEDAELGEHGFDLVASATAFHWIEAVPGLEKIRRLLKPHGAVALFWNVLQDLDKADPFHDATERLLAPLATTPSGAPNTVPYALDRPARETDAMTAGFTEVEYQESKWTYVINTEEVGTLYGGFSQIQRLEVTAREELLSRLMEVADTQFKGRVERNVTTCLYLITE